jgi:hypothetical protein
MVRNLPGLTQSLKSEAINAVVYNSLKTYKERVTCTPKIGINKSTNQQINKSTNQQINKSTNQLFNWPHSPYSKLISHFHGLIGNKIDLHHFFARYVIIKFIFKSQ